MPSKGHKGKGTHRKGLSLDSSFGNSAFTSTTESPKASKNDGEIDIISYEQAALEPEADVRVVARGIFDTTAASGTYSQAGNILAFGNLPGHRLLEEQEEGRLERTTQKLINAHNQQKSAGQDQKIAHLEQKSIGQDQKIAHLEQKNIGQDQKIADLNTQVNELKILNDSYMKIRNRFLDVYRRDIWNEAEAQGTQAIKDRNRAAHHGDAVADASLYESCQREDESLLVEIYGFSAREILSLSRVGDYDSIWVLNARATLKAIEGRPISLDIEKAWEIYVSQLQRNWHSLPKENPLSPLGRAYSGFEKVYKVYKKY
ncbi:MAG: hypothetical protein M1839_000626 [Geoglossum umbratile]|nr:MAG: hypothetical protein M1839_000626 [Geoglossum umbratile]